MFNKEIRNALVLTMPIFNILSLGIIYNLNKNIKELQALNSSLTLDLERLNYDVAHVSSVIPGVLQDNTKASFLAEKTPEIVFNILF